MGITMKELFTSLKPGDLLTIPLPMAKTRETILLQSAVLRQENEVELYLSALSEEQPSPHAYAGLNPFRWSDEKNALVDKDGDVPVWYSTDIQLERGGAIQEVAEYRAVPRVDRVRHIIKEPDMELFLKDPRFLVINGIIRNGEAGWMGSQLSLALDLMNVEHTKEQLIGLTWFLLRSHIHQVMQQGILAAIARTSGAPSTEEKHTLQ